MIYSYMEREIIELQRELDEYLREQDNIDIIIREKKKFITVLENNMDQMVIHFSPYDVNRETQSKISMMKDELSRFTIKRDENLGHIARTRNKICQYKEIASEIKKLEFTLNSNLEDSQKNRINSDSSFAPEEAVENGLNDIEYASYRMKILETQENERQRIARDIHDEPLQELTSLIHKIDYCTRIIDRDVIQTKIELLNIQKTLRKVISGTRGIIYDLKPMAIDDIGFEEALSRELKRIENDSKVKITLLSTRLGERLNQVVKITLYRIVQEACSNAIIHGNPTEIMVVLEETDCDIHIKITDNGNGFDMDHVNDHSDCFHGFGLTTMKERIFLLSGKLLIHSEIGKGTIIDVFVPKMD